MYTLSVANAVRGYHEYKDVSSEGSSFASTSGDGKTKVLQKWR